MDDQVKAKFCADKLCDRLGRKILLSEFTVNRAKKDGYSLYCNRCTQRQSATARDRARVGGPPVQRYRVAERKTESPTERVLQVLRDNGPLEFRSLRRMAQLSAEQLFTVLAEMGGRQVASKNGTGPRVYFVNPNPLPAEPASEASDFPEPPFSFSTISFLYPVIGGSRNVRH